MTLRNRELLNLIAVSLLTAIGFASVYIARSSLVDAGSLTYAGIFVALYLLAHLVARFTVPFADPVLLPLSALLAAIGVTMIYRLDPDDALRQGLWIVIAVGLFALTLVALRHDYRLLESYKYLFGISAILLLMLPALPGLGQTINGARLWVKVGSFQFQPGELAKIFLIIFLAGYLREKREVLAQGRIKDFGPLLLIWGAAMLVLVQTNDLGSALLQFGIFLAMLYVATGRAAFALAGLGLFIAGAAFIYHFVGHVHERVTIWLHPWTDEPVFCASTGELALRQDCGSFQLVKSLYSIANGGFGGTGLGKGTFTTTAGDPIIPFLNTDFIYSAIAQELGLVGAAGLLLVFMLFVARGMRVALMADDGFSKLLAAGLTFGFALQTFIIVGGVLRVIPLTGITLPFVSYGGSSVVANFILLALLLLVSNRANAQASSGCARLRMNRQITRLALAGVGLIVALVVATTYWQTWAAGDLADRQDNQIERVAQFTIKRGEIKTQGALLARNVAKKVGGRTLYFRDYPTDGLAAHVVGYSTQSRFRTGLERSMNDYLTGSNANLSTVLDTTLDRLKGATIEGNDLQLTLNARAQQVALQSLGSRCGAVVALEPDTGKVLVMASSPTYNPNDVEGNFDRATGTRADCKRPDALLNRATAGLYAPGSTFKVVTAVGRDRLRPLQADLELRRSGLLRGLRQAGQQLRHLVALRPARPAHGAEVLGQLGLLQHRQGARSEEAGRVHEALRLLLDPAPGDAHERAGAERPLQGDGDLRPDGGHRRRPGPVRLRPGAPAGDAAADGDGRRDDRERRCRHAALRRRPGRRTERLDRRPHEAAGSRPGRQARNGEGQSRR